MKIFNAKWLAGTIITTFGTVALFVGIREYITVSDPLWLIIAGLIAVSIGGWVIGDA